VCIGVLFHPDEPILDVNDPISELENPRVVGDDDDRPLLRMGQIAQQ
jgi:hypothetical protein